MISYDYISITLLCYKPYIEVSGQSSMWNYSNIKFLINIWISHIFLLLSIWKVGYDDIGWQGDVLGQHVIFDQMEKKERMRQYGLDLYYLVNLKSGIATT